jgi:hypothetical protein
MARYRIFYVERQPKNAGTLNDVRDALAGGHRFFKETDWEEPIEANNAAAALDSFFREHAGHPESVMIIEEDGRSYPVPTLDYDPDRTYVWIEGGSLMEYQGMAEATEGTVTCPLCDGAGEVDEEIAREFADVWSDTELVEE